MEQPRKDRRSDVFILDEPTAALDPVAENEIYRKFNSIVNDKTAIFISHRMAACTFCDKVLVFQDGKLVQNGSHYELLKEKNKIFATARGYGELKGGWEFPGGKVEPGETPQQALVREIMEELDTEIKVGDLVDTIEYDYPTFHLSMDCFWAEVTAGHLELKEAEAAKWLTKDQLDSVVWLPADITLIDKIREQM